MLGKRTKPLVKDGEIIPHNIAKDIVGATLAVAPCNADMKTAGQLPGCWGYFFR